MALRADEVGLSIGWVGGVRGYRLSLLRDLCLLALGCNKEIENARVRKFSSLEAFRNFTRRINDRDSLARIDLVRRHSAQDLLDRLRHLEVKALRAETSDTRVYRDVLLATVHKAKGMEWHTVMLAEDFPDPHELAHRGSQV
jgi:superfamily I DNA/RNA helicase